MRQTRTVVQRWHKFLCVSILDFHRIGYFAKCAPFLWRKKKSRAFNVYRWNAWIDPDHGITAVWIFQYIEEYPVDFPTPSAPPPPPNPASAPTEESSQTYPPGHSIDAERARRPTFFRHSHSSAASAAECEFRRSQSWIPTLLCTYNLFCSLLIRIWMACYHPLTRTQWRSL